MNYILTKACNKGCPYCFAHESQLEDPRAVMSFEDFKMYANKYQDSLIKLLGGEPTLHPDFNKIIDWLMHEKRNFVVISNFLFKDLSIRNKLIESVKSNLVTFLVNATDLDIKDRIDLWSKNYTAIYNALDSMNQEIKMSIGLTIDNNKTVDYYDHYIDFLLDHIKTRRLRISLDFPGSPLSKNPSYYVNNIDTGNKIIRIIKKCLDNRIIPKLDCILYPCMFPNKDDYSYVCDFLLNFSGNRNHFVCSGVAADLGPDGHIWHCYPLKGTVEIDGSSVNNAKEAFGELKKRKKDLENKIQNYIPDECKHCEYYRKHFCQGPALCHYNLSKIDISNS